jgi:L-fuconolactonase
MTLAMIDTHMHLWDPAVLRYGWMEPSSRFNCRFGAAEFAAASHGLLVSRAVFVQCDATDALAEVLWVSEQAALDQRIAGIVAFAPVDQGDAVRAHLKALSAYPLVKGVRWNVQDQPETVMADKTFRAGIRAVADYNYVFDLCIRAHQLPATTDLVRACPNVRFVLDHLGKPDIKAGQLDPWRSHLSDLAALPNVVCKLSGLVTEADHAAWSIHDLRPFVNHMINVFGPDRVLWGSDWPIVLHVSDYRRWCETTEALLGWLDPATRQRLLHDNAIKVYRLS